MDQLDLDFMYKFSDTVVTLIGFVKKSGSGLSRNYLKIIFDVIQISFLVKSWSQCGFTFLYLMIWKKLAQCVYSYNWRRRAKYDICRLCVSVSVCYLYFLGSKNIPLKLMMRF
jgi:predicted nucleic-acid-binding Zn-ribbon protein